MVENSIYFSGLKQIRFFNMARFLWTVFMVLGFCFSNLYAQNFSTHQVKKGETIKDIARYYFVNPTDIYQLNPDAKKELKANSLLIIPLSKSRKPKTKISRNLQGFKKHKTKRKQTLYSIAKLYDISEAEIKQHNPFLYSKGLKKGHVLKIPLYEVTEIIEAKPTTKNHQVLPKETKWGIAYKFGITIKELENLNPNMGTVLKEGALINVPNLSTQKEKKIDTRYSYYKVLAKEGFYRLKIKLGLEQSKIEALNPEIKEGGLKEGMILKIPFTNTSTEILTSDAQHVNLIDKISDFKMKQVAIMLPFRLDRVDFDSISETKKSIKKDPYLSASLDFYSGVLTALDSLKQLGVFLKVDVYDTKNQISEISKIITTTDFQKTDAIIGPLTTNNFNEVAFKLKGSNIPIISPIGSNLTLHDHVFQSKPTHEVLKSKIINYVQADSLKNNIIIISDAQSTKTSEALKIPFSQAHQVNSHTDETGADAYFVTKEDIQQVLKPGNNTVFLETNNAGFASNVTSILVSLIQKEPTELSDAIYEIKLVTTKMNAAFESEQINNSHLSKLQFHFASVSKEYNELIANPFVTRYKAKYHVTPNKKAVKGFDLTMDVILRLVSSENLYNSVAQSPLTVYVENKFSYRKSDQGGYYNDAVYLVKYDGLNIVEIKN